MVGYTLQKILLVEHTPQLSLSLLFEGYPLRSDTNRTGAESLSFYYPRLLYCLNQMLAMVLLSQHQLLLSKTIRPHAPCGARCIGHAIRTWSAICSEAPHSQFTTLTTQASWGKLIPTGLALVPGTKARSLEAPSQYSVFHLQFVHSEHKCRVWQGCPKDSAQLA